MALIQGSGFWENPLVIIGAIGIAVAIFLVVGYLLKKKRRAKGQQSQTNALSILPPIDMSKDFVARYKSPQLGVDIMTMGPLSDKVRDFHCRVGERGAEILAKILEGEVSQDGKPYLPLDPARPYFALVRDTVMSDSGLPSIKVASNGQWPRFERTDEQGRKYIPVAGIAFIDYSVLPIPVIFLPEVKESEINDRIEAYMVEANRNEREHDEAYRSDPKYYVYTSQAHRHPIFPKAQTIRSEAFYFTAPAEPEGFHISEGGSGELYACVHDAGAVASVLQGFKLPEIS